MNLIEFIIINQAVYFLYLKGDLMTLLKILVSVFFKASKSLLGLVDFNEFNSLTETLANYKIVLPSIVQFVAFFLDTRFFTILIPIEFSWIGLKFVIAIFKLIKSFIPTISGGG